MRRSTIATRRSAIIARRRAPRTPMGSSRAMRKPRWPASVSTDAPRYSRPGIPTRALPIQVTRPAVAILIWTSLATVKKQDARIFQAPSDVGNRKPTRRDEVVTFEPPLRLDNRIVLGAMKCQHTPEVRVEVALRIEMAVQMPRGECHIRPPSGFEHAIAHPVVAQKVAALPAGGIDNDFALGIAGSSVRLDGAAL